MERKISWHDILAAALPLAARALLAGALGGLALAGLLPAPAAEACLQALGLSVL